MPKTVQKFDEDAYSIPELIDGSSLYDTVPDLNIKALAYIIFINSAYRIKLP